MHVAQGRTVDTAHLLVTGTLSRQALYVGMTRGRQSNTAHVVTGKTAPPGHQPYQQATAESVLAEVMRCDAGDLSATEQIRQAQDWTGGTSHLIHLWSAATRRSLYPDIDQQIKARLSDSKGWRYDREHQRHVLQHKLRRAQLAGHDISQVIEQITAGPMDGARSISSVLHGRLQRLQLSDLSHDVTWAQRTPETAPALALELAAALDERRRALGERAVQDPEPWLTRHLGPVPGPDASPALLEDYAWRAGTAAAYREARGITNPQQAVSFDTHPEPELEAMRQDTFRALEIADEQAEIQALSRGELEGRVLDGDRTQATAPRDVSQELRLTAQAEADAWLQSADAEAEHDHARAANARTLAAAMAAEKTRLEAANARYEQWSASTAGARGMAGKARAELQRRGQQPAAAAEQAPGRQTMAEWWREFEAHAGAMDRAIDFEHQAAINAGQPWPPQRQPQAGYEEPEAAAPGGEPQPGHSPPYEPDSPKAQTEPTEALPADSRRAIRLDELQAWAAQAVSRIDAQRAELDASNKYTARVERETQAEPEADRQAGTPREVDLELEL